MATTGKVEWKFKTDKEVLSSPMLYEGDIYFGSFDGHLYVLDAKSGIERWRFRTRGGVDSSPKVYEGVVYFGSWDNHLYAVEIPKKP